MSSGLWLKLGLKEKIPLTEQRERERKNVPERWMVCAKAQWQEGMYLKIFKKAKGPLRLRTQMVKEELAV